MASEYFAVRRGSQSLTNKVIWSDLSYAALGLLLVMLAAVDDQPKGYRAFQGRGLGQVKTRAALKELEEAGLRVRVRWRRFDGQLREFVVVSDVPIDPGFAVEYVMARKDIPDNQRERLQVLVPSTDEVDGDVSESLEEDDKTRSGDRASISKHGCDKGKCDDDYAEVSDVDEPGKTPSRGRGSIHRSTVDRATVGRATVARGTTFGNKDSKESQPNQTGGHDVSAGWVGSGNEETEEVEISSYAPGEGFESFPSAPSPDLSGHDFVGLQTASASDDDWLLIAKCLPPGMQAIDPTRAAWIASLCRKRVSAGWPPGLLRATLGGNLLPANVRNLTGLVAYRISALPLSPPPSLTDLESAQRKRQREEAQELRANAVPMPDDFRRLLAGLTK